MTGRIDILAKYLQDEIQKELEAQGHIASGKLHKSISVTVERFEKSIKIVGRYLYYGRFVDTGRRAGVKRVPIDALIEWIRIKKISASGMSDKQLAFAIQTSIFKKGIPTDGNEKKKRFVSRTLEQNEAKIKRDVTLAVGEMIQGQIYNMVEETKKNLK